MDTVCVGRRFSPVTNWPPRFNSATCQTRRDTPFSAIDIEGEDFSPNRRKSTGGQSAGRHGKGEILWEVIDWRQHILVFSLCYDVMEELTNEEYGRLARAINNYVFYNIPPNGLTET